MLKGVGKYNENKLKIAENEKTTIDWEHYESTIDDPVVGKLKAAHEMISKEMEAGPIAKHAAGQEELIAKVKDAFEGSDGVVRPTLHHLPYQRTYVLVSSRPINAALAVRAAVCYGQEDGGREPGGDGGSNQEPRSARVADYGLCAAHPAPAPASASASAPSLAPHPPRLSPSPVPPHPQPRPIPRHSTSPRAIPLVGLAPLDPRPHQGAPNTRQASPPLPPHRGSRSRRSPRCSSRTRRCARRSRRR